LTQIVDHVIKVIWCGLLLSISWINSALALELDSSNALLIDYDTEEILYQKEKDELIVPSSLTKLMTAYIIFDQLNKKAFTINDKFKVSIRAWRQDGNRMLLEPEWKVTVHDLLLGMLVISGNDAAVTLAEGSMDTLANFVDHMNEMANNLKLTNSHFENPNGVYEKTHYMSVQDIATLYRALIKNYGEYYERYFSQKTFTFRNVTKKNINLLLIDYNGLESIKTGYNNYGKYSVAAAATRHGKRLIAIIAGAKSSWDYTNDIKNLLDYGFSQYSHVDLFKKDKLVGTVPNFFSPANTIDIYTNRDITYSTKISHLDQLKVELVHNKYIYGPLGKNSNIAQLIITDGNLIHKYDLYSRTSVPKPTKFRKFIMLFYHNLQKLRLLPKNENAKILE
jgi:D-alanyl-D-alanine carboxypeptidase (penicillin-binding protein 5/6)